jgi:hypothetical protein
MLLRALLVLLVVVNLGVATWWILRPVPVPRPRPAAPAGVPRLQLLSEVPAAALPDPEPVLCLRFGPYAPGDEVLSEARARLAPLVLSVRSLDQRGDPGGRWRVMLPPAPAEDADALVERLVAAGFGDVQPVRDGPDAGSVALGLFGGEAGARTHRDRIGAAGFPAQVHADGGDRSWLVVGLDAAQAVDADTGALRAQAAALQVEEVDCESPLDGPLDGAAGRR